MIIIIIIIISVLKLLIVENTSTPHISCLISVSCSDLCSNGSGKTGPAREREDSNLQQMAGRQLKIML